MTEFVEKVDVDVPVSAAYGEWRNFEDFPNFLSFIQSIKGIDDTHNHWKVRVAGIEREFDAQITEQIVDQKLAWRSIGEGVTHFGIVTFDPLSDSSSRITVRLSWTPEGFIERAGAVLGIDRATVRRDLKEFKSFMEGQKIDESFNKEEQARIDGEWDGKVVNS